MSNKELVEKAIYISKNKSLYGMGTWGWIITESTIARKQKESSWWTNARANNIRKYINKGYFMFDCIGLIKGILWGFNSNLNKIYGGAGYACNGVPDLNTEQFLSKCVNVSTDFSKIEIGEYLWMSGHCGIYIGNGLAVECTPAWTNGVQITAVSNIGTKSGYHSRKWTKHAKIPYITYIEEKSDEELEIEKLKKEIEDNNKQITEQIKMNQELNDKNSLLLKENSSLNEKINELTITLNNQINKEKELEKKLNTCNNEINKYKFLIKFFGISIYIKK